MGSAVSRGDSSQSYHVLQVTPNSPGEKAGLNCFFDFIIAANDHLLDKDDSTFFDILTSNINTPVKLRVFNALSNAEREAIITPNRDWGGAGLAGINVRMSNITKAITMVWHVVLVHPNGPASTAGLESGTDFVIGVPGFMFFHPDDFYNQVKINLNKPLAMYVYSTKTKTVRVVTVTPDHNWGGNGFLGCDVAYGLNHQLVTALNVPPAISGASPAQTLPAAGEPTQTTILPATPSPQPVAPPKPSTTSHHHQHDHNCDHSHSHAPAGAHPGTRGGGAAPHAHHDGPCNHDHHDQAHKEHKHAHAHAHDHEHAHGDCKHDHHTAKPAAASSHAHSPSPHNHNHGHDHSHDHSSCSHGHDHAHAHKGEHHHSPNNSKPVTPAQASPAAPPRHNHDHAHDHSSCSHGHDHSHAHKGEHYSPNNSRPATPVKVTPAASTHHHHDHAPSTPTNATTTTLQPVAFEYTPSQLFSPFTKLPENYYATPLPDELNEDGDEISYQGKFGN